MWHMPGHTYSKLHRYADAAWQQEASARVDHAHMMRDGVLPDQIHNYAHNNEWLIRNLAFLGRVHDAVALAENMISLPRHPKYNTREKRGTSSGYGHGRLEDVLEQYECWEEIVGPAGRHLFDPAKTDLDQQVKRARFTGVAQFSLGNASAGQEQIAVLEKLLDRAADRADQSRRRSRIQGQRREEVRSRHRQGHGRRPAVESPLAAQDRTGHRRTQDARRSGCRRPGRRQGAARQMQGRRGDSQGPPGPAALAGGRSCGRPKSLPATWSKAEQGRSIPLALLVEVLYRADKKTEARAEFEKLRPLAASADLDVRVFQRLAPIAKEFGWPEDWRGARVERRRRRTTTRPGHAGAVPLVPHAGHELDAAGRRRQARFAAGLSRPAGGGDLLSRLRLPALRRADPEVRPRGGELLGRGDFAGRRFPPSRSTSCKARSRSCHPTKSCRFRWRPIPEMNVFKSYRAYDDFENSPLHGVFLIDAQGLIRWQDISYEPFTDAKFLLEEAKRLLK